MDIIIECGVKLHSLFLGLSFPQISMLYQLQMCLGFLGVQVYKMKHLLTPVLVSAEDWFMSIYGADSFARISNGCPSVSYKVGHLCLQVQCMYNFPKMSFHVLQTLEIAELVQFFVFFVCIHSKVR